MIRNIIFDYGGVIIDLDFNKQKEEFQKLGVENFNEQAGRLKQTELFNQLDTGKISEHEFRDALRKELGISLTDEQIDHAWDSLLAGIKEEKIKLLTHLISSYRTFLLSNTNFIHLKAITKYLLRTYGRVNLDSIFDKVYYSCALGIRKPDPEIYLKVISDNSLKPSETLYVDDSAEHVEGAARVGLIAEHYDLSETLEQFISRTIERLNHPAQNTPLTTSLTGPG